MNKYEEIELEVIEFKDKDMILTSCPDGDNGHQECTVPLSDGVID